MGERLQITRGDSALFEIMAIREDNGDQLLFEPGDTVHFTVKTSVNTEKIEIQKVIKVFEEGLAIIRILPEDTKHMRFIKYVYDVQLTRADGLVKTFIGPAEFEITAEVTYD